MDITLNGAKVLYTIHTDIPFLGDFKITQTIVMTWIVMAIFAILSLWLTHGLRLENITKRQAAVEYVVGALDKFVHTNMGLHFDRYIPLVGAIFSLSVFCNLISVFGVWSPTADLNTELAWAIVVFIIITYYKIKTSGIWSYLKGYLSPIFIMAPINVLSELATPVSMACRHFGNILSGMVIGTLVYSSLAAASYALLSLLGASWLAELIVLALGGWLLYRGYTKVIQKGKRKGEKGSKAGKIFGGALTLLAALGLISRISSGVGGAIANVPWLDVGVPAMTGLYFDWFGGCIQAFIFCTLTTIFIRQAAGED